MARDLAARPPFVRASIALALAVAPLLGGCCRTCPPPTARATSVSAPAPVLTLEQRVAVDWLRRARAAEPNVTARLRRIATQENASLAGLEHKFKSLSSTILKLERLHAENPELALEDIEVYDTLRYTLVVPDDPLAHHDAVIRTTLGAFEQTGHAIRKVKNYWPRGDSYSGTNCTLATPDGFAWELQFHTPESYAAKSAVHDEYDRMRDADTPIEERRRVFEKMKAMWESIPIPEGILVPGSLHASEEIRVLPAP